MFEIAFDERTQILHLRLEGYWGAATFARFAAAMLYHATRLGLSRRRYGVLSDSSAFAVQSPAIAAAFDRIMRHDKGRGARAVAIVVGSTLNRMQVRRTLNAPHIQVFDDRTAALAWVKAELALSAAA